MQARSYLILAAVVFAAAAAGVVVVIQAHQVGNGRPGHGDFSTRFQPTIPAPSVAQLDRQRQAGIGSIRELRPVDLTRQ